MGFHRVYIEDAGLRAEGRTGNAVRVTVDVVTVVEPLDLDGQVALRHVARDKETIAGVHRAVEVERFDHRLNCSHGLERRCKMYELNTSIFT